MARIPARENQIVTSMPWVSIIEDAKESLLRSHWDLVIVDEAHTMSADSQDHKTMAYQLGEALSDRTESFPAHYRDLYKGDPANSVSCGCWIKMSMPI